jgi:hypothetical protein
MSDRLDALHGQTSKTGKTYWNKIGAAFKSKKGEGYTLYLDYLPLNGKDGKIVITLAEPRQKTSEERPGSQKAQSNMDDEVPF